MPPLMQQILRLRGELLWVLAGHAAAFLGGLVGIKLLTRQLGASEYGHLALGLTIAGFLTTFLHNPLSNAAARFYAPYRDCGKENLYFFVLRSLHTKLLLLLILPVMVGSLLVYMAKGSVWGGLVLWGLVFGMISGVGVSFLAWQNAARDRRNATLAQIGDVWLRIGCAIFAAIFWGSGSAALGGYCVGSFLVVLWQYRMFRGQQQQQSRVAVVPQEEQVSQAQHEFVTFVLPFVGYALFTVVTLYADRWVLQLAAGTASVGIYAALFQIAASPVNLLFAIINQLMVPIIYERAGTMTSSAQRLEVRRLIMRIMLFAVICSGTGTVLTALLGRPVALLLTTTEFTRHSDLLWMLVLGLSLWQVGQLMALVGICANRPGIYLWPKAIHAFVLLGVGGYLVVSYGVNGMAAALIIASVAYLVAVGVVNFRLERLLRIN
ncbi:polysaccharide biosynthesis protein [Trichlorobacter lovleyi SZ]|uniref:Polysaccharide biosynthesis protein n=2 Tax=Trichlorobacter lovleyi TaxID=313985 RepID=B3E7E6_TRIL1|nr:polysaccharide biosynthesis protein [Trichlorobacter lovleyi SZ]